MRAILNDAARRAGAQIAAAGLPWGRRGRAPREPELSPAVIEEPAGLEERKPSSVPICEVYVDAYVADYARRNKPSSTRVQVVRLRRFREDFKGRTLAIGAAELRAWADGEGRWSTRDPRPASEAGAIVALYNHAIRHSAVPFWVSPARGLSAHAKAGRERREPRPRPAGARRPPQSGALDDRGRLVPGPQPFPGRWVAARLDSWQPAGRHRPR